MSRASIIISRYLKVYEKKIRPDAFKKHLRDFGHTFIATVFVHVEDFVLRASLVTRMLKLWPTQSLANWYLHAPLKLYNLPSKVR